jgi:hypothetical protein
MKDKANELTLEQAIKVLEAHGACDLALAWLRGLPEGTTPREALAQADGDWFLWAGRNFVPEHADRAEFEAKYDAAWAECEAAYDAAGVECEAAQDAARGEYDVKCDAALAKFDAKYDAMRAEYEALFADDILGAIAAISVEQGSRG